MAGRAAGLGLELGPIPVPGRDDQLGARRDQVLHALGKLLRGLARALRLRLQKVHVAHHRPAGHQLQLRPRARPRVSTRRSSAAQRPAGGRRHAQRPAGGRPPGRARARCAVKDWRLEFQNASTKILLYLMATGQTVAPRSNAPRLNMTQYSLFTHVPSGKMSSGVVSAACTCAAMRSATSLRSLTCAPRRPGGVGGRV